MTIIIWLYCTVTVFLNSEWAYKCVCVWALPFRQSLLHFHTPFTSYFITLRANKNATIFILFTSNWRQCKNYFRWWWYPAMKPMKKEIVNNRGKKTTHDNGSSSREYRMSNVVAKCNVKFHWRKRMHHTISSKCATESVHFLHSSHPFAISSPSIYGFFCVLLYPLAVLIFFERAPILFLFLRSPLARTLACLLACALHVTSYKWIKAEIYPYSVCCSLCINANDVGFCVKWRFWRQLSFTHFNSNDVYLFYVDDFFLTICLLLRILWRMYASSILINWILFTPHLIQLDELFVSFHFISLSLFLSCLYVRLNQHHSIAQVTFHLLLIMI